MNKADKLARAEAALAETRELLRKALLTQGLTGRRPPQKYNIKQTAALLGMSKRKLELRIRDWVAGDSSAAPPSTMEDRLTLAQVGRNQFLVFGA